MFKKCISLISFFLVVCLFSCKTDPSAYQIKGKLDNIQDGYFYMSHEVGDSIIIDSVLVDKNGDFLFKGIIDTLTEFSLYFNQKHKSTYLFVDKGLKIEMNGDVLYPDLIEITGGEVNNDLTSFKKANKELLLSRAEILNHTAIEDDKNDSTVVKDYIIELKNVNFELSNVAQNYIKANPEKIASVMLINNFFKDESSLPRLDESLGLLKGKAVDFPLTLDLKFFRDNLKKSAVGATAPNFTLTDQKGKEVQLIDFRNKYILLSFISTTCEVCKEEKEDAIKIYNQIKNKRKDIEFISIVKDVEEQPLDSIVRKADNWIFIPVKGGWSEKTFNTYYIREIPYNILISPTGIILERDIHILDLPKKLQEYAPKKDNK